MLGVMILCGVMANGAAAGLLHREIRKNRDQYKRWKEGKPPSAFWGYSGGMIALAMGLTIFLYCFYGDNTFLFTVKCVILLALLWPVAYTDFETMRIPNLFVAGGLAARVLVLAAELLFEREDLLPAILSEAAASVILFLVAALCALIVKNSIGGGDMKLFIVMGLFLGLQGTWGAMFLSLVVSFVIAVVVLVSKKKSRKDAIPFGPALMIGTYLSIFLTGM